MENDRLRYVTPRKESIVFGNNLDSTQRTISRQSSTEHTSVQIFQRIDQLEDELAYLQHSLTELRHNSIESLTIEHGERSPEENWQSRRYSDQPWLQSQHNVFKGSYQRTDSERAVMLSPSRISNTTEESLLSSNKPVSKLTNACHMILLPVQIISTILLAILVIGLLLKLGVIDYKPNEIGGFFQMSNRISSRNLMIHTSPSVEITASSYVEYQTAMTKIEKNDRASVIIKNPFSDDSWPKDVRLENSKQVVSLRIEAAVTSNFLYFLLQNMPMLEELVIYEKSVAKTTRGPWVGLEQFEDKESLDLPKLKSVALAADTTDISLLKFLLESVSMSSVTELLVSRLTVTETNLQFFQNLLRKLSHTLERLDFNSISWHAQLQVKNLPIFQNLRQITLDYIPSGLIALQFNKIFPMIRSFNLTSEFAKWTDIRHILSSKTLETLECCIYLPEDVSDILSHFESNKYSKIEAKILVDGENTESVCNFYYNRHLSTSFRKLVIDSIKFCPLPD